MAAVNALAGGALGFVDTRPCPVLAETCHDVAATTCHPGCYHGACKPSTVTCATRPPSAQLSPAARRTSARRCRRRRGVRRGGGAGRPDSHHLPRTARLDGADALPAPLRSRRQGKKLLGRRGSRDCPARRESSSGTPASRRSWARQLVEHLPVTVTSKPVSTAPIPSPPRRRGATRVRPHLPAHVGPLPRLLPGPLPGRLPRCRPVPAGTRLVTGSRSARLPWRRGSASRRPGVPSDNERGIVPAAGGP